MNVCPVCSTPLRVDGICSKCLLKLALESRQSPSSMISSDNLRQLDSSFPHLSILRMVGRGGMGTIYHARQTSLDRDVALKIIDRSISNNTTFLDRFEREAKALAKLNHPNIVSVFDYGNTSDGQAYFIMEFVHGLNLREAMQSMPIDLSHSTEIVCSVATALTYAHTKGVIHRDIKPENILLSDDGSIKLADFGIAKINNAAAEKKITATRQVLGTVHYLAPEQLEASNEVDHRVDIYALGVVFYELLTKQLPVGNFEPPSHLNPAIHRDLDSVILKSLSRKPSLRFQTVEEFQQAILSAVEKSSSVHSSVKPNPVFNASVQNLATVTVPFQCEGMKGFSMVHGAIQANDDGLRVEYRSQDAFFGTWKSKLRKLELPWNRLVRVELKPGVFESKLQVYGDTFSLFEDFPGTEGGYLTVKVSQHNPSALFDLNRNPIKQLQTNQTIAVLLIIFGFLNAGTLAILQVAAAESGFASSIKAMLAVAIAVCIGPLIIIQMISGMIYASTGVAKIGQVGVIASMLPLSPLFVFSFPFANWANRKLSDTPPQNNALSQQSYPRWGVTTMIFMKESKHATLVSTLESLVGVLLVAATAVWVIGVYPSKMQYRVVGSIPSESVKEFVKQRLYEFSDVDISIDSEQRFTLACWRYQRNRIADRLSITEKPKLLTCVSSEGTSKTTNPSQTTDGLPSDSDAITERYVPIFAGEYPKGLISRSSSYGAETLVDKEIAWDESWLGAIQKQSSSKLKINWSKNGLSAFREQMIDTQDPIIAIQINGWIEAVADKEDMKDNSLSFQWLSGAKRSIESIQSALRGPSLSAELELLE